MNNKTRWRMGIGFTVAVAVLACVIGYDLSDTKKMMLVAMVAFSYLSTVAIMSAWGEDLRTRYSSHKH